MIRFWHLLMQKREDYILHFKGKYFTSDMVSRYGVSEISWHGPNLFQPNWQDANARCLAVTLGDVAEDTDGLANVHVMMNMHWEAVEFEVPQFAGLTWRRTIDTAQPTPLDILPLEEAPIFSNNKYLVTGRSIVALTTRVPSSGGGA
jgi:glycogen operon protein